MEDFIKVMIEKGFTEIEAKMEWRLWESLYNRAEELRLWNALKLVSH